MSGSFQSTPAERKLRVPKGKGSCQPHGGKASNGPGKPTLVPSHLSFRRQLLEATLPCASRWSPGPQHEEAKEQPVTGHRCVSSPLPVGPQPRATIDPTHESTPFADHPAEPPGLMGPRGPVLGYFYPPKRSALFTTPRAFICCPCAATDTKNSFPRPSSQY